MRPLKKSSEISDYGDYTRLHRFLAMRIISGKYKSRRLKKPPDRVSPTKDNVKETIFNILKGKVEGANVLDLFSGSGSLALEALSREAEKIFIVDRDISTINKNLEALSLLSEKNVKVYRQDAFSFIRGAKNKVLKFSIIFLDPPYYKDMAKKCLHMLSRYDILHPNGIIIAEHESQAKLPQLIGILRLIRTHKAGNTTVSFYKK